MRITLIKLLLLAYLLGLMVQGCGPTINKEHTFTIEGPCESCPAGRLIDILRPYEGIVGIDFNPDSTVINIKVDSTKIPTGKIVSILNDNGYSVYESIGHEVDLYCCKSTTNDPEAADVQDALDNLDDSMLDEMEQEMISLDDDDPTFIVNDSGLMDESDLELDKDL